MSTILLLIAVFAAWRIEATDPTCTKKLDFAIGVDASSSNCGLPLPCPNWKYLLQFIVDIVNGLNIGADDTRVAFVTASDTFKIEWNWNRYTDKDALLSAIGKIEYKEGELIDLLSTGIIFSGILKPEFGDRASVRNVMIGFTDGMPLLNIVQVGAFVKSLQTTGARVIVVCLKPGCTERFANAVATEPKQANVDYFVVDNFQSLNATKENLMKQICAD